MRPPSPVLMTADAVGGVWDYSLELARGLAEEEVAVVLAVMGPPPDEAQRAAAAAIPGLELACAPFRLEWMDDPWADVAAAGPWLLELERRHGCQLVHLSGYTHGALPFRSPKVVVGHSCVLSWWRAVHGEPAPRAWDRYRSAVAAGLAAADRVVAPTAAMAAALEESYGPLPPIEVIWNGRRPDRYRPGDKECFVLSAGRLWDQAKNAAVLAGVAERLPWPVQIAGATRPDSGGSFTVAGGAAVLLGRLGSEELAALCGRAAIYAAPARYEPFGLAVLEAALSECALVLSDIPSFRELWSGAAVFVPADDAGELETTLLTLMNQPELSAALALRAHCRALRYSATLMTERYLTLYRSLAAGRLNTGQEVRSACVS
jgi:glycogen(starch) synthase